MFICVYLWLISILSSSVNSVFSVAMFWIYGFRLSALRSSAAVIGLPNTGVP